MSPRLTTVVLGVALFAAGCTTSQPTAWNPEPIPAHPTGYTKAPSPQPAPTSTASIQAVTPSPASFMNDGSLRVMSETQWTSEKPIPTRLDPMGKITCITIHHEGESEVASDPRTVADHLRDIRKVHVNDRRYGDIAYHFLIDPQGIVWEGRSLAYQGAHAGNQGANKGNIGICLLGDFDNAQPTQAQKDSLRKLTYKLMAQYNVPTNQIYTHREVKERFGLGTTDCPGKNLQCFVNQMRAEMRTASR